MTITKTLFAATALVLTPAIVHAAPAAPGYETVSVDVRTDDINLTTPTGRSTLDRRIERAVREACGYSYGNLSLSVRQAQRSCMKIARDKASVIAAAKISQQSVLAAK